MSNTVNDSPLGQHSEYISQYDAGLLFPIPRVPKWEALGLDGSNLPFSGSDTWNALELSWLDSKGKPVVMAGVFILPAGSPNIIESKSFKLYLNSFNQTRFNDASAVRDTMTRDLSVAAGAPVRVELQTLPELESNGIQAVQGDCIDGLDVAIDTYTLEPAFLQADSGSIVTETLCTHLLKSNCPVTGQPDWGTLVIEYTGPKLDHEGLLKYICSFRQHQDFHEQCVERIFMDLKRICGLDKLTVYARYVRRGGLDINPWRSDCGGEAVNTRLARQ
ncbi:NADPH-dependent 7-cyano-7-deazaguanine reductase QueF [Sansalvadorimonas sp. 2012CJ34-2]|uniref:NADPH-dependent 7-cyano-7-deazaguanine reductase n=1 Tax=Parendozoicomonas callyspongiae TaxID=2942213 RepID=A0ABT0PIQ6_9GAMM|nr:NADPH-dependent 7-cyano-7-deazaguanine reductase QueF [Sansalvadorimonas sp. 2012CJ34-2]MCL6271111.1 NADPH-dependent 7-cyano-7-deazaguanine reductase QueF [Sansalvadorimonas sp. 2012CJ34-2]